MPRSPVAQQLEEVLVSDRAPQHVQGDGSAFVHPVVEHVLRARVGQQQILWRRLELLVIVVGPFVCGLAARLLRPQPLRVAGEPLVEPDVAPAPGCHRVAEPLVGQFVRNEPLCLAMPVAVVGAEDRNALRLKRNLEVVVRHHDGVTRRERIRSEQLDEELHHVGLAAEVVIEVAAQALWQCGIHRDGRLRQPMCLVFADLQGHQIRRRRLGLFVGPGRHRGAGAARLQLAVGHCAVGILGADLDAVAGLGTRMVVAGEPGRGAVGLAGHQCSSGELLESDFPPKGSDGPGSTRVAHDDRHGSACGQR
jgi:hypothetical protein